jgi:hypothetical protein
MRDGTGEKNIRVNGNGINFENGIDLLHNGGATRFDTIGAKDGSDIIGPLKAENRQ